MRERGGGGRERGYKFVIILSKNSFISIGGYLISGVLTRTLILTLTLYWANLNLNTIT